MQQYMYGLEQLTSLTDLLLDSNPLKNSRKVPKSFQVHHLQALVYICIFKGRFHICLMHS